jgi:hypothetical protein
LPAADAGNDPAQRRLVAKGTYPVTEVRSIWSPGRAPEPWPSAVSTPQGDAGMAWFPGAARSPAWAETAAGTAEATIPAAAQAQPSSPATPLAAASRPETPPVPLSGLAEPLVEAIRAGERDVTVTLSPQELGAIRVHVTGEGEALRLMIVAERPETLDLMRRHADALRADLAGAGLGGTTLGFGSTPDRREPPAPERTDPVLLAAADRAAAPRPAPAAPAGALDLRL